MKQVTLIFCGENANAGLAVANQMRSEGKAGIQMRDAAMFSGEQIEAAEDVIIMPDVSAAKQQMLRNAYHVQQQIEPFMPVPDERFTITPVKRGPGRPRKVAV